ncbi:hypothetical protein LTR85_009287 [Meristemomyces frigidus]|nr:hypothetical protein LTR85_009287 [Meristemomyces frigidus]
MDGSPFARLPPELRNQIYEPALTLGQPITTLWWPTSDNFLSVRSSGLHHPFALAQTCRAMRSESSALCYNLNAFELRVLDTTATGYEHAVRTFLSTIGPANAAALRTLAIDVGDWTVCRGGGQRAEILLEVARATLRLTKAMPHLPRRIKIIVNGYYRCGTIISVDARNLAASCDASIASLEKRFPTPWDGSHIATLKAALCEVRRMVQETG